jgi:mannose-6-phosphate isomerase-like protein (cupin superfamily)
MKTTVLLALLTFGFVRPALAADAPKAEAPPTETIVLEHGKVDNAFAKGLPLLINSSYKIQTGHRVVPGIVEYHEHDTDILYITEGSATIVTGGTLENPKTIGAGEIRGDKITGGTAHKLTKGDIIVIPHGVPHWFTEVSNPCLYLVIKVTK